MDVRIRVAWSDGSVTEHSVPGMPYDDVEVVEEVLSQKLADYLDPAEWPESEAGMLASVWVKVA